MLNQLIAMISPVQAKIWTAQNDKSSGDGLIERQPLQWRDFSSVSKCSSGRAACINNHMRTWVAFGWAVRTGWRCRHPAGPLCLSPCIATWWLGGVWGSGEGRCSASSLDWHILSSTSCHTGGCWGRRPGRRAAWCSSLAGCCSTHADSAWPWLWLLSLFWS